MFVIKLPLDTPNMYGYNDHKETIFTHTMYIIFMCGGRANLTYTTCTECVSDIAVHTKCLNTDKSSLTFVEKGAIQSCPLYYWA